MVADKDPDPGSPDGTPPGPVSGNGAGAAPGAKPSKPEGEDQTKPASTGPGGWSGKKKAAAGAGAVVLAAGLLGLGILAGERLLPGPEPQESPPAATVTPSPETPEDFVEFRDEETGFVVAYPPDWEQLEVQDAQVRLLVTLNNRDSFLVRAVPLEEEITVEEVPAMRPMTDEIVTSSEGVEVHIPAQPIVVDEVPGYFYLYSFNDEASGERGVHSHYFLFHGDTMITLVFQALPEERFEELADTFDRIAESFRTISS